MALPKRALMALNRSGHTGGWIEKTPDSATRAKTSRRSTTASTTSTIATSSTTTTKVGKIEKEDKQTDADIVWR